MDFKLNKNNLNFRVYTATATPETGTENDIVVITETPMKNWILSPDAPGGAPRTDGDAWLQYSVSGNIINVLKQNSLMIYPVAAYQYVNGAWVEVTAMTYQSGEWVEWYNGELFKNGRQYTDITGGWSNDGYVYYRVSYVQDAPTIGDTIIVDASTSIGTSTTTTSIAGTQKAIDVTDKTALSVDVISVTGECYLVVTGSDKNTHSTYALKSMGLTTTGKVELDIRSLTGEVYFAVVAVHASASTNKCEVNNIRLA